MTSEKKRIVIWCGDAPNQKALANKIAGRFNLYGIVVDKKRNLKKTPLWRKIPIFLQDRIFFKIIINAWSALQHRYGLQYPGWPDVLTITVDSINSDEAFNFTQQLSPDLIVVSGTSLVKKKMLSLAPSLGIVNLHTGLSPYIKGGPNCTNWCISTGQFEKIGNTIMWINEGIDSGNIIVTERTLLNDIKSLKEIQWKVMEHAHELYLKAIFYLLNFPPPHNSVPQKQIASGKLYLTRMWNFSAKRKLLANLPPFLKKGNKMTDNEIITVTIKENIDVA
jgi:Formyl transferase